MFHAARRGLLGLLAALCLPAAAQDLSVSGFGTIGYARSNRSYNYLRNINDRGTLDTDSVLGVQADLQVNPEWSATLQLKASESLKSDDRWDVVPAWAFIAWRPNDDWLLRAGRLRVPFYLHSEALDVGVTHDMARLPAEMYSIAPTSDINGLYATRTWQRGDNEISLDAYAGQLETTARLWSRDGVPPAVQPGAQFLGIGVRTTGLALMLRQPDALWRLGLHHFVTHQSDGSRIPIDFPFVDLGNGLGYYKVDDALPGPPVQSVQSINNYILTFGVEQQFATDWRVAFEFERDLQRDTKLGSDNFGGYLALFRRIGNATPYVSIGVLRTGAATRQLYQGLTQNPLPAFVPGAALINAAERLAAESTYAVDQRTLAIGASYLIGANQKLKVEWARTQVGQMSRLVDSPPGEPSPHDTNIDVLSLSYNFNF